MNLKLSLGWQNCRLSLEEQTGAALWQIGCYVQKMYIGRQKGAFPIGFQAADFEPTIRHLQAKLNGFKGGLHCGV